MAFRFFNSNLKSTQRSHLSRIITLQSLLNKTKSINVPPMGSPSSGSSSVTSAADVLPNTHFMIWKRGHVGHSHNHDHNDHHNSSGNEGERIFRLGLAADISLAAGKAITGYLTGSTAIIADAAHSLSDVVLSGVALWSFKAAMAPKDKEHPYGHGKFETLGALGISGVLLATSGGIAWHAMDVLVGLWSAAPEMAMAHEHVHEAGGHAHGIDMNHPVLALNMTIVSIAVKEWLYWITKRTGERVGSGLMKANAWHHRADAISSIVALIGVGGSILGVRFLDPLAGLVVSGMICKAGIESGYQSVLELVDAAIPSQQLEPYRQTILQVDGVKGCNHLRGRRAGSFLYLDVNVEVDPFLSVSAAHGIAENVRRKIQMTHPEIAEVFIHIEPSTSHIPAITGQTEDEENTEKRSEENPDVDLQLTDIEDLVSIVLSERFREKMHVERVTRHVLQGKILLEIEVSMPINMSIRDAVTVAEEAEKEIKGAVSNILGVSIQLRLTGAMIELNNKH